MAMSKAALTHQIEKITPKMAAEYLATSRGNRTLRLPRLAAYERDLKEGRFGLTHQGIAFDEDGYLVDGHHRMQAVINTGISITTVVVRGLSSSAVKHVDGGLMRTTRDALRMAGEGDFSTTMISTARNFEYYPRTRPRSEMRGIEDILATIERHREALTFACEHLINLRAATRAVRAVVGRAYYHADRPRLIDFCGVMRSGMPMSARAKDDEAAVTFYRWLSGQRGGGSQEVEAERYHKGQGAVRAFLQRAALSKVYAVEADLYPLPSAE